MISTALSCLYDRNLNFLLKFAKLNFFQIFFIWLTGCFAVKFCHAKKWTVEELQTQTFPYMTTNDLFVDVCKSSGFIDDIALTHAEILQLRRINDTLKRLTKEITEFQNFEPNQLDDNVPDSARTVTRIKKYKNTVKKYKMVYHTGQKRMRRAATARKERIWDHGVIPYEIQANFSGEHHALFRKAMNHWENHTCVTFVPRTPSDENYILFTVAECGCCSYVGKRGEGAQAISIGKNCDKFGIVVHELGHVIGFWHEHTRPDRDQFVDIFYRNIQQGQDYNFEKLKTNEVNSLGQPYDYNSIMHYARDTFARAMYLDTILPKPDHVFKDRPEIGQRIKLSHGDIAQTNLLYKCPSCGRTFLDPAGDFGSPSTALQRSKNREKAVSCQWRIFAPRGHRIQLNLTKFSLPESQNCANDEDALEMRDGHYLKSPLIGRFCGIMAAQTVISSNNRLWIEYKSSGKSILKPHDNGLMELPLPFIGFKASYEIICGGELKADYGIIESTNYPRDYKPDSSCVWTILVPDGFQVAVIFTMFQLEQHENCIYDYVEFRDGPRGDSPLLGRHCGYTLPLSIKSTGNEMRVKFATDSSVEKAGFSLQFMKEFDECETSNHGCQHKCVNTLGSYKCACDIGYELHSDGKSCEEACGGYLKNENGTLTSPNFPSAYPHKKKCVWEIEAHPQYRITLNFTHFDLEGVHTNCEYDYLRVTSIDSKGNTAKFHGNFCGRMSPIFSLTSETSHLRIEFSTDSSVSKSGFAAVYFTDRDECEVDNGGCEQICKNLIGSYKCECSAGYLLSTDMKHCKEGGCKHELVAPSGQLKSPNYPLDYPNKKDCIWHVQATPGHRIQLVFTEFEIEPHQDCAYDRIELYDGSSALSKNLGKFCGLRAPEKITTGKNELFMLFKSDSSVQRRGFVAFYNTICGGTFIAGSSIGQIFSHAAYGGLNYDNKMTCDWLLTTDQSDKAVEIRFLNFELEEEYHCEYDNLEIFDGGTDRATRISKICGNRLPPILISSGSSLRLQLRTDDTVGAKGFFLEYRAVEKVEGISYTTLVPGPTHRHPLEPVINEKIKNNF